MVGGRNLLKDAGAREFAEPESAKTTAQLGDRLITTRQPVSHVGERLAEKGKSRLREVQAVGPAAKGGRIGHAIRIFERRRGLFPGAVLHKAPPQCLTARQQAVMRVRERKQRQEGEGLSRNRGSDHAGSQSSRDTHRAPACGGVRGRRSSHISQTGHRGRIISSQLAAQSVSSLCGGAQSGINRIVLHRGSAPALTRQDLSRKRSPFLLKKTQLEENNASRIQLLRV